MWMWRGTCRIKYQLLYESEKKRLDKKLAKQKAFENRK